MKPILLVIAHEGFQPVEYDVPKRALLTSGFEVKTASDLLGTAISAIDQEEAEVDLTLDSVAVSDYDGIFFIGGPGALEFLNNEKSYRVIQEAAKECKVWGAICISPRILAEAGVLKGRKATGWDDDGELVGILSGVGAEYIKEPVVVDGNLITASGPAAAEEFGREIVRVLK